MTDLNTVEGLRTLLTNVNHKLGQCHLRNTALIKRLEEVEGGLDAIISDLRARLERSAKANTRLRIRMGEIEAERDAGYREYEQVIADLQADGYDKETKLRLFCLWVGERLECEGATFSDGSVAVRWLGIAEHPSTAAWGSWESFRYACIEQWPERTLVWTYNPGGDE